MLPPMSAPQPPAARSAVLKARTLFLGAVALTPLLCLASLCVGKSGLRVAPADAWAAFTRILAGTGHSGIDAIVELRLWQALTTAGVGAALGLAGALVQGLFRNPLASPSILGISSGASLGSVAALVLLGSYEAEQYLLPSGADAGWLVPLFAFLGALGAGAFVFRVSTTGGRVSIPALLLMGLALNTILGGLLQWIQSAVLDSNYLSRSILSWSFGTLDDRLAPHAMLVWGGLALALCVLPFVAYELDLMQAGLEDAEALGVARRRDAGRLRRRRGRGPDRLRRPDRAAPLAPALGPQPPRAALVLGAARRAVPAGRAVPAVPGARTALDPARRAALADRRAVLPGATVDQAARARALVILAAPIVRPANRRS
jgi:ABC-type Fe3+-siderophore transport system permease subunit